MLMEKKNIRTCILYLSIEHAGFGSFQRDFIINVWKLNIYDARFCAYVLQQVFLAQYIR